MNVNQEIIDKNISATIYPNFTSGNFNVIVKGAKNRSCRFNIYNALGKIMCSGSIGSKGNFDLSNYPAGFYLFQINAGSESSTHKLIINH
jgi:hypothetical protein